MNIRKKIDYSPMLAGLRTAMESGMTHVELYAEIGRSIALRPEKGAAVAASEYLDAAYPLAVSAKIACWGKHPQSPLNSNCVAGFSNYSSEIDSLL